jgi:hypothetical protein
MMLAMTVMGMQNLDSPCDMARARQEITEEGGLLLAQRPLMWQFDNFMPDDEIAAILESVKSSKSEWKGCGNQEHVEKKHCASIPVSESSSLQRFVNKLGKLWGPHALTLTNIPALRYLPGSGMTPTHHDHTENEEAWDGLPGHHVSKGVPDFSVILYLTGAPPGEATINFPQASVNNNAADTVLNSSSGLWVSPAPGKLLAWVNKQTGSDGSVTVDPTAQHRLGGLPADAPEARYALQLPMSASWPAQCNHEKKSTSAFQHIYDNAHELSRTAVPDVLYSDPQHKRKLSHDSSRGPHSPPRTCPHGSEFQKIVPRIFSGNPGVCNRYECYCHENEASVKEADRHGYIGGYALFNPEEYRCEGKDQVAIHIDTGCKCGEKCYTKEICSAANNVLRSNMLNDKIWSSFKGLDDDGKKQVIGAPSNYVSSDGTLTSNGILLGKTGDHLNKLYHLTLGEPSTKKMIEDEVANCENSCKLVGNFYVCQTELFTPLASDGDWTDCNDYTVTDSITCEVDVPICDESKCDHWCDEYTCDKDRCADCAVCVGVNTDQHCSSWCNVYTCTSTLSSYCDLL